MKSKRAKERVESIHYVKFGKMDIKDVKDTIELAEQDTELQLAREYAMNLSVKCNELLAKDGFYEENEFGKNPVIGVFTVICALNAEREVVKRYARDRAIEAYCKTCIDDNGGCGYADRDNNPWIGCSVVDNFLMHYDK